MSNIIDSIQVSGTTYQIQGSGGGGGNPTVELTQAEYDALVTAGTVSANTYYIITDAQAGDLTQYWTSAQTNSAITASVSGKADTTAVTEAISAATSGKYDSQYIPSQTITNIGGGQGDITYNYRNKGTTYDTSGTIKVVRINNNWLLGSNTNLELVTQSDFNTYSGATDASLSAKVETSAITTAITSGSTDAQVPSAKAVNDKLGGLSVVKLTESEYTALVAKDSDTLYVVIPDPSN